MKRLQNISRIILLFLLYMPMRILLSPIPTIPIPDFRNFVKYPEITEKWSKWATAAILSTLIVFGLSFFTSSLYSLGIFVGLVVFFVLLNLVVMHYRVTKYKRDGRKSADNVRKD